MDEKEVADLIYTKIVRFAVEVEGCDCDHCENGRKDARSVAEELAQEINKGLRHSKERIFE